MRVVAFFSTVIVAQFGSPKAAFFQIECTPFRPHRSKGLDTSR